MNDDNRRSNRFRSEDPPDAVDWVRRALQSPPPLTAEARQRVRDGMAPDLDEIAAAYRAQPPPSRWAIRRPLWAAALAVAAASAIAIGGWIVGPGAEAPPVPVSPIPAELRLVAGSASSTGLTLDRVHQKHGERWRVPAGSRARIEIDHRATLTLPGPTEYWVRGQRGSTMVTTLIAGQILGTAQQPPDQWLLVTVDSVRVHVASGVFSIQQRTDGMIEVGVLSGAVRVETAQPTEHVDAGQLWIGDVNGGIQTELDPRTRTALAQHQALFLPESNEEGELIIAGQPTGAEVRVDQLVLGKSPLAVRWPKGRATVSLHAPGMKPLHTPVQIQPDRATWVRFNLHPDRPGRVSSHEERPTRSPGLEKTGPPEPVSPEPASSPTVPSIGSAAAAERAYLAAEALLLKGRTTPARDQLQQIVDQYPATPQAATALMDLARLWARAPDGGATAMRCLDQLLVHPEVGSLREPAWSLRCQLLAQQHKASAAEQCQRQLDRAFPLHRHPSRLEPNAHPAPTRPNRSPETTP